MKPECVQFKKEIQPTYINSHSESNKSKLVKAVKSIIEAEIEDFLKIEMIESKLLDYKVKMRESIDLFC
jgi:hypothetical protein